MSRVTFSWDPAGHDGAGELKITVDEVALPNRLAAIELADATAEDHPDIAGNYAGLAPWACPPDVTEHFHGSPGSHLHCGPHDKTVLMGCTCGEVGCWPLMARISVEGERVRWADFEQPHRRGRWTHDDVAFVFDRSQYDAALESAQLDLDRVRDEP